MIRSFLPVGQGAFYKETFYINGKPHHVIYDCGSTCQKHLESVIDKEFHSNKKETIDAVFISHFHRDHINGIKYLLQKCDVKNLFIPYLTEEDERITILDSYCRYGNTDNDVANFLANPIAWCREKAESKPTIFQVYSESQERRTDERMFEIIPSGNPIYSKDIVDDDNCPKWMYVPFNYSHNDVFKKIKDYLRDKCVLFPSQVKDLPSYWEKNKRILRKAFDSVNLPLNMTSLVLFSGSNETTFSCHCARMCRRDFQTWFLEPDGCLYMGDFNANYQDATDALRDDLKWYLPTLGCLQVPHHGSSASFNEKLTKLNDHIPLYVISHGTKNSYGHPDCDVLKKLFENRCSVFSVNEKQSSRLDFYVQLYSI